MVSICVLTDFYGWQQIVLKQIHSEVGYFSKDEDGLHLNHKPRCSAPIFYLSGIVIRHHNFYLYFLDFIVVEDEQIPTKVTRSQE